MNADRASSVDSRLSLLGGTDPGDIDPEVVGAKAANLMQMADAGLPVPPGFVLSTRVCAEYHSTGGRLDPGAMDLLTRGVQQIERTTGRRFGALRRPLLLAVRSGAAVSMPGMLETILDVGLCDATVPALLRATGDPSFVWDSYQRLIRSYAEVVDGCPPAPFDAAVDDALARYAVPELSELDVGALRELVGRFQDIYRSLVRRPFPQEPTQQLLGAVEAVLRSWNAARAVEYRRLEGLSDLEGTAVTIQAMVFGNLGVTSGAGVGFTRDPATGQNRLYVDFLLDAQGEDVVAGRHAATDPEPLIAAVAGLADQLQTVRRTLEELFRDAQDFEFTVEDGKLWLLQSRIAKRTPWAALQIACDLVDEGLIDRPTALDRLRPYDLDRITRVELTPHPAIAPIGRATPASGGVASGHIALDVESAIRHAEHGESVILVRDYASTGDIAGLAVCRGLLTATGARTSHAAVVARQLGIVCLVNCSGLGIDLSGRTLHIGDHRLGEDDTITIDATSGQIYPGSLGLTEHHPTDLINRVRAWQSSPVV